MERSNKANEAAVAAPARSAAPARAGVADLRAGSAAQVQLVEMVNASERVAQLQSLQRMANAGAPAVAAGGLDPQLRSGIEALSGVSMASVQVHRNSPAPAQLQAHAYAQGEHIHLAPGQEHHLAHEAWHVVQQKQGRVRATTQRKGIGLNDDAALENEADRMGQVAQRHPGGQGAVQAYSSPAAAPVQRVKIPFAHTDGSEYDPEDHKEQKATEMAKFAGLPGRTTKPEDFTWHHIVPQSHLKDRALARSQMMIRLGPSTSYRLDDPGNDYTDPNFKQDGTHTPFSEAVEGAFAPGAPSAPKLDHTLLASKLALLVSAQQGKASGKAYADPVQWHLALADLQGAIGLTPAEKKTLAALAKPTNFSVKGIARKEDAIAWSDLHQSKIDPALWAKMHAHLSRDPKTYDAHQFFRGHQEHDALDIKRFHMQVPMRLQAILEAEHAIDADAALHAAIQANGKIVVFLRDAKALSKNVVTAVSDLAKSQGLGQFQGNKHDYYLGSDGTKVDAGALYDANTVRASLHHHKIGEHAPVAHTFGNALVADAGHTKDVALTDEESQVDSAPASLATLLAATKSAYTTSHQFTKDGLKAVTSKGHISSAAERTELQNLILAWSRAKSKAGPRRKVDRLVQTVSGRVGTVDTFAAKEAQRRFEGGEVLPAEEVLGQRKLDKFRQEQSRRISKLNEVAAHLPQYVNRSGAVDAQHVVGSLSNSKFLMHYWPDFEDKLLPALKAHLMRLEVARPKEVPPKPADFAPSIVAFEVDAHAIIKQTLTAWSVALHKFIGEKTAELVAAKADIGVADALLMPSKVGPMPAPELTSKPEASVGIVEATPADSPLTKKAEQTGSDALARALKAHLSLFLQQVAAPQNFLVDQDGGILPAAFDTFVNAYRADLANTNAYLTEGEAHAIATRLGIVLNVYRGATPPGFERVDNDGGGNCLIHAIYQAQRQAAHVEPTQATASEIHTARQTVAAHMDRDYLIALSSAAVAAQIAGQPEHGLGRHMRALVNTAHMHALLNTSGEKAKPHAPSSPSKAHGANDAIAMPRVGAGNLLEGVALLHTGGNHWVMIRALPGPEALAH